MKRLSEVLLPAFVLLLCGVMPATAQINNAGASARISNMPGLGLTYPETPADQSPATTATPAPAAAEVAPNAAAALTAPKPATAAKPAQPAASATPAASPKPTAPAVPPPVTFDSKGQPYSGKYYKEHTHRMTLAILRHPGFKQGQFALLMSSEYPTTGCQQFSNIPSKVEFKEGIMEVTLDDYTIDMRHMPDAPQYACHTAPHRPSAEIVLDRDDLLKKGVTQIELKMAHFTDGFDVDLNDQRLRLTPSSQRTPPIFHPMRGGGLATPLTHWFYPPGTVILYAPTAPRTPDTGKAIASMAGGMGLEPMDSVMPDFISPITDPNYYYFVDKKGMVSKDHDIDAGAVIGTIPLTKTVYGLEKDETQTQDIKVLARTPDSYE